MKQFLRTVTGKTVTFMVCTAACCAFIVCAVSMFLLASEWTNAYTADEKTFSAEAARDLVTSEGYSILSSALKGQSAFEGGNLVFSVSDDSGSEIAYSDGHEGISDWDYTIYYAAENIDRGDFVEHAIYRVEGWETVPDGASRYVLRASIRENMQDADEIALCRILAHYAYALRYAVYWIGLAALVITAACFVALMTVSGRKSEDDALHPGALSRVPFDVLLLIVFAVCIAPFGLISESFRFSDGLDLSVFLLIAASGILALNVLLGFCMSIAVRIKQRTLFENTIICRLLRWLIGLAKKLHRFNTSILHAMPMMRRFVLILLALLAVEFIILVNCTYDEDVIFFWLVEKVVLVPLALYFIAHLTRLQRGGEALASGDLSYQVNTNGMHFAVKQHAENLNHISVGMSTAVEERLKSERMKTELITNVSHDIKTPLTSIINYAILIGSEPCENDKIKEYSSVLMRQSDRLKRLIEDLIEASKASTGNLDVMLAPCDASVFLTQISGEYEEKLQKCDLTLIVKQPEKELRILADSRRMWRIFDNLMNNICKYAQSGTRVYLSLEERGKHAVFTFKNTSRDELDMTESELMERFTRGDRSRSTDGNGLGLSIARSIAELQKGRLHLDIDGDLFKATLVFPLI